jgi:hypothetical protein
VASEEETSTEQYKRINRKATVVLEHIFQASDYSYTMQEWKTYNKFNKKLFEESYLSHIKGRARQNPFDHWYESQLDHFDSCIIPLAQKLQQCDILGQTGDELLEYAQCNRSKWARNGKKIVKGMNRQCLEKYGDPVLVFYC